MNLKRKAKICLSLLIILFAFSFLFLNFSRSFAQLTPQEEREILEKELKELEDQILQYENDITKTQQEKKTLQNKITVLKKKVEQLNLQIQQSNVMIKDVSLQIKDTEGSIEKTALKIEDSREKLADILRNIYEEDQKTLVEILLSESDLSDFFNNLTSLESLNSRSKELIDDIKILKSDLETQKQNLDDEKGDLENIAKMQMAQRKENEANKKEQEQLLEKTKGKESEYQKLLAENKKKAAEIRARILELVGVREAPRYDQAIAVAKQVSQITGVRAAFLLGILTQESRIGKNVGQCYLEDPGTGMGIKFRTKQKWPRVMKPSWTATFLEIIKGLGLSLQNTPVSCWIPACVDRNYNVHQNAGAVLIDSNGNITCNCYGCSPFGWGGAMGPAQLMPFNWIGKYKEKIEAITHKTADPWDFSDATLGAALHLVDCGALYNEKEAAACYFGGWGNRKSRYHLSVYASPVMKISQCHQDFVDSGTMSSWCEELIF